MSGDALTAEEAAFVTARAAVDRTAARRWFEDQGVDLKTASHEVVAEAKARWSKLQLLNDPNLSSLAFRALAAARGRLLDGTEKFPLTIWMHGAEHVNGGRTFHGSVLLFVRMLEDRAQSFAAKREGWVVEPTTNTDGRRVNESTVAMHALFLDCDGTGEWDALTRVLDSLKFCYVAYQSGGWSPQIPKWRIVLPLHAPLDTSTEQGRLTWKGVYNHARVVLGCLGRLASVGFDPTTETPCNPWFLTERRSDKDPVRRVRHAPGHALDLAALALALPEAADERAAQPGVERVAVEGASLSDERMNQIIDALVAATANVPTGRRDLYLALPGALLDRGVCPDDVIAIIEAISMSYPRKHADKHADNIHCARTTIGKWLGKTHYTRIGTLQSAMPHVAAALDSVLPSTAQKLAAETERMLAQTVSTQQSVVVEATAASSNPIVPVAKPRKRKRTALGKEMAPVATKLKASNRVELRVAGHVVSAFLDGAPLPPATSQEHADEMLAEAMRALGRDLSLSVSWADLLNEVGQSLAVSHVSQSVDRIAAAERAFYEGKGKRNKAKLKKATQAEEWGKGRSFFTDGQGKSRG